MNRIPCIAEHFELINGFGIRYFEARLHLKLIFWRASVLRQYFGCFLLHFYVNFLKKVLLLVDFISNRTLLHLPQSQQLSLAISQLQRLFYINYSLIVQLKWLWKPKKGNRLIFVLLHKFSVFFLKNLLVLVENGENSWLHLFLFKKRAG